MSVTINDPEVALATYASESCDSAPDLEFGDLTGKVITGIMVVKLDDGRDVMYIKLAGYPDVYIMHHKQECCECVELEDICGDLDDIINTPILHADVCSSPDDNDSSDEELEMWTFYNIGTIRGSVTLRWLGTSNGYYSMEVTFERVTASTSYRYIEGLNALNRICGDRTRDSTSATVNVNNEYTIVYERGFTK